MVLVCLIGVLLLGVLCTCLWKVSWFYCVGGFCRSDDRRRDESVMVCPCPSRVTGLLAAARDVLYLVSVQVVSCSSKTLFDAFYHQLLLCVPFFVSLLYS